MRSMKDEITMRRYLLMDFPENRRAELEGALLTDEGMFEEIVAVENDLIDAYVRGELAEGDKRKFETAYLASPDRRTRVEFARALNQRSGTAHLSYDPPKVSTWKRVLAAFWTEMTVPHWALSAAALTLVVSGSWLLLQNWRLHGEVDRASIAQIELRNEKAALNNQITDLIAAKTNHANGHPAGAGTANVITDNGTPISLTLLPTGLRSGGPALPVLRLPRLRLELMLESDNYQTYEAELQTVGSAVVLRVENLHAHQQAGQASISLSIPSQAIHAGDYVVQLKGRNEQGVLEGVQSYSFRVAEK